MSDVKPRKWFVNQEIVKFADAPEEASPSTVLVLSPNQQDGKTVMTVVQWSVYDALRKERDELKKKLKEANEDISRIYAAMNGG